MFEFPDFKDYPKMRKLFGQMGIDSRYVRSVPLTYSVAKQYEYFIKLRTYDDSFDVNEIRTYGKAKLLIINENPSIIYIKNLYNRNEDPRYHLVKCRTIENMINGGRRGRYVATNRTDGQFIVNINVSPPWEEPRKLLLCKNCQRRLKEEGLYEEPFSLDKFFSKYHLHTFENFQRDVNVHPEEPYGKSFKLKSNYLKKQAKYKCSECGVDCTGYESCLHCHHIDGDRSNNSLNNLKILCVVCHSNQPFHEGKMKNSFMNEKSIVRQLRKSQGIN